MTEPGFQVEAVQRGVPFRARATYSSYQVFEDSESVVLVDPVTALALRTAAAEASPRETGGLLSGRLLRDAGGRYVLVAGHVEAPAGSGGAAAFNVSPQATARMREESARAYPTADVVGWWHSHLGPSHYSQTDLASQSVWKQPQSVGLLVFAAGEPWATAYLGPDARHLGHPAPALLPQVRMPSLDRVPVGALTSAAGRPGPPGSPAGGPRGGPGRSRSWSAGRLQGALRLAMITLVLCAVLVLAAVYILSTQLRTGQQALSRQLSSGEQRLARQLAAGQAQLGGLRRELALRNAPSISSACVPLPLPATTGSYRCTARAPGARGTIEWQLNGKPSGTGHSVVISTPLDGHTYQILALLQTGARIYPGVAEDILPPTAPAGHGAGPAGGHTTR